MSGTAAYLSLPGVSGAYASTPDTAALSITGDIDIRVLWKPDSSTFAALGMLVTKLLTSGQFGYEFRVEANGTLTTRTSVNGSSLSQATSSVAAAFVAGGLILTRVTRRASDGRIQFFTDTVWGAGTQLGTDKSSTSGSLFDGTDPLGIGAQTNGNNPQSGKFLRAQIRNNIADDGTGIVFDADFTTQTPGALTFTESSSNLATVTLNGKADIVFRDPMPANYQYVQAGDGMSVSEGIR